jgi:hypothetical protein
VDEKNGQLETLKTMEIEMEEIEKDLDVIKIVVFGEDLVEHCLLKMDVVVMEKVIIHMELKNPVAGIDADLMIRIIAVITTTDIESNRSQNGFQRGQPRTMIPSSCEDFMMMNAKKATEEKKTIRRKI